MNALTVKFAAVALCLSFVSGLAGPGQAQSNEAWKITTRQSDAVAETRIGSIHVSLHGRCKSGSAKVTINLEGYSGNALGKTDQVDRQVVFVSESQDGGRVEHRGEMFLFGNEVAMRDPLPTPVVDRLAISNRLSIRNTSGQSIVTVSLGGIRRFTDHIDRLCGPGGKQAQAQTTSGTKANLGLSAGPHCFVDGFTRLKIILRRNGDANFDLVTSSPSTHVCALAGQAKRVKAGWRYTETLHEGAKCRFDILLDASGNVRFNDEDANCKRRYCGERAFFEDVTLGAKHRKRC
ncbi:MAG: hypothetical protein KL863_12395 [Rhizobium sp.]|nr:hypothetical protein [Rhizobium sp.]